MKPGRPVWSSSRAGGFTLIEVMMVVAILGLTLTMGMPAFLKVVRKEGMGQLEQDLLVACQTARRTAIMNNVTAELTFHPGDGTFQASGMDKPVQFPRDVTVLALGVNFIDMKNAEVARVHFYPNGTSDEFTLLMQSGSGSMVRLDLDTIAGLAVIKNIR